MVFIFQFVNVVYHIDWFADIKESLHSWDKAHLVMVYDFFNMLLDSVGLLFLETELPRTNYFIAYLHITYTSKKII